MTIKEIKTNLNNLQITVMIQKIIQGVATSGKLYLTLMLKDNTGQISARIWDVQEQDLLLQQGTVINLLASSLTYNNEIQLKVISYQIVENPDEQLINKLVTSAPIDPSKEWDHLITTVQNFTDDTLKSLLIHILTKYKDKFYKHSAAVKMHHSTRNGLLWHTITMLKTGQAITKIYHDREINHDLLYAGIILHDFGKIWELSDDLITSFTLQGQMLGHIVLGSEYVKVACLELGIDDREQIIILLQHLILASHGKYEYGSPVLPKTLEAEILHHIDNLDAKITIINDAIQTVDYDKNTNRIISLDNRVFIRHFKNKKR